MNRIQSTLAVALLSFIPAIAFSAGNAAEGKNKSAVCHACNGAMGKSGQPIYPNLGGQHQDYLSTKHCTTAVMEAVKMPS